jgi:hypothetical protein
LSTVLKNKRDVVLLIAAAALLSLLVALVVLLPGQAEAQDEAPQAEAHDAPTLPNEKNTTQDAAAPAPEGQRSVTRTVEPGDSLWKIAQEQLGQNAPPELIGQEVAWIFELNRERIGNDPDLILPGQELLLTEVHSQQEQRSRAPESVANTPPPAGSDATTADSPVATTEQPVATPEPNAEVPSSPKTSEAERAGRGEPVGLLLALQSGLFLFALAVAIFGASKMLKTHRLLGQRRQPSAYDARFDPHRRAGENRPPYPQRESADEPGTDAPGPEPTGVVGSRSDGRP